jgi:hypothetical protein
MPGRLPVTGPWRKDGQMQPARSRRRRVCGSAPPPVERERAAPHEPSVQPLYRIGSERNKRIRQSLPHCLLGIQRRPTHEMQPIGASADASDGSAPRFRVIKNDRRPLLERQPVAVKSSGHGASVEVTGTKATVMSRRQTMSLASAARPESVRKIMPVGAECARR